MASHKKWNWLLLLVLVCVLSGVWYWLRSGIVGRETAGTAAETRKAAQPLVPMAESGEVPAAMDLAAVASVLRDNAAPGRVVFLSFWLDAEGAKLVSARGTQGRGSATWPAGLRRGVLVYELRDKAGAVLAEGEVEDPLNRRLEYETPGSSGSISSTWVSLESSELMLRIPGLPSPAAIELYRGAPDDPARRVSIGRIQLQ